MLFNNEINHNSKQLALNKDNNSPSEVSGQNFPLVSVIIPVYNGQETICRAVDNVLEQSYREREVIVVDDGSADSSIELLRRYGSKIRLVEQRNSGVASARNHGINLALRKIHSLPRSG